MDNSHERRQAVKSVLWQVRHEREEELHRDISLSEQAEYLEVSYKSYQRWENGTHLPRAQDWPHLIQRIGPRMALALGLPENISPEILKDWRFLEIAADWPNMSERHKEILIAIAKRTAKNDPGIERFFTELERATA